MKHKLNESEKIIADALASANIQYVFNKAPEQLDFYLPDFDVFIEVKTFHSGRIAEQMSRAPNVIAVQGVVAAKFLAQAIRN